MIPKRLLLVTSEFPPLPGGIGKHAFDLATSLVEMGHLVCVLTNARAEWAEEGAFDQGLPFQVLRVRRYRFTPLTYVMRLATLWKLMRSFRPTNAMYSGKFSIWMIPVFKTIFKVPSMAIVHGSELGLSGLSGRWMAKGLKCSNVVVAVSQFTAKLSNRLFQHPHVVVIPNGLRFADVASPAQQRAKIGSPMLITVGSISPRKGQHNVIQALPRVLQKYPSTHYHIIGLDHHRATLDTLIQRLGLSAHVTIHGSLSNEEKVQLTAVADVFLMLSENQPNGDVEGFGISILEANALGVPAIGSKGCGIEDAISPLSGLLVDPKDPHEVAQAVFAIQETKESFEPRVWAERFDWKELVQDYNRELN
jgi:glycosyltransferase involved in cell wall biosynthesis